MIDPKTPQEWQEAADCAEFYLALHSARLYGLIETKIRVDVDRCEELLRRAKGQGVTPAPLVDLCKRMLKGVA